jgi:membrane protease YdiL (CAAX protease family)
VATPRPIALEKESPRGIFRKILCNEQGLRSGWRLALYLTLVPALGFVFHTLLSPVADSLPVALSMAAAFLLLFLPALLMSKIEKRSIEVYGLSASGAFGRNFLQGCAVGMMEVTLLVGFLAVVHRYSFGPLIVHGTSQVKWALECARDSVAKALCLQFLFRGYTQYTLAEGIGFWSAAEVLSALFATTLAVGGREDFVGLPILFLVGMFWSLTLRRKNSLWFAIGMQTTFNFGATFLYSVPNRSFGFPYGHHLSNAALHGSAWLTGGSMGVEGSPLRIVTVGVLIFLVNRAYPGGTSQNALVKT